MTKAYDMSFRHKVIEAWKTGNFNISSLGREFNVSETSVRHWVRYYEKTGKVKPLKSRIGNGRPLAIGSDEHINFLIGLMRNNPKITIRELCGYFKFSFKEVSHGTMQRSLKRLGLLDLKRHRR